MPAVLNASPLIHLVQLTKVKPAQTFFRTLYVPPSVYEEVVGRGKEEGYADAFAVERLEKEGELVVLRLGKKGERLAAGLRDALGSGEAEAIALAQERGWTLLMDDDHGRRVAQFYGVETRTTLATMLQLAQAGRITMGEYVTNVRRYAALGWITADVVERFLEEAKGHE